ncbi:MAG: 4Fe-4S binding protein, partial [Bacillota bacterium]|nr:4Fe-4S binding protein [Bacillota bacterium]
MKQLVILSGKGGTGKTTLAVSLIKLSKNKMFADCDVDAPNVKLIFENNEIIEEKPYFGLKKAFKFDDICINCGKCEELCRFNAIKDGVVNINYCEGCGVCERFCPVTDDQGRKAIRLEDDSSGTTRIEKLNNEIFSNANLKIGNGASGKLVTEVRKNMYKHKTDEELAIIDGSPGIGCPVIASLTGIEFCLLVAEPSISGIHD